MTGPSKLLGPKGPETGYKILASFITVMGKTLPDFEIHCHTLAQDLEVDGVIGLDILRMGAITIDLPGGQTTFRWVKGVESQPSE